MNWTKHIQLTTTIHLTLMMTSTQVVEMSVTTTNNSASQDYTYLDNQTTLSHVSPDSNHLLWYHSQFPTQLMNWLLHVTTCYCWWELPQKSIIIVIYVFVRRNFQQSREQERLTKKLNQEIDLGTIQTATGNSEDN